MLSEFDPHRSLDADPDAGAAVADDDPLSPGSLATLRNAVVLLAQIHAPGLEVGAYAERVIASLPYRSAAVVAVVEEDGSGAAIHIVDTRLGQARLIERVERSTQDTLAVGRLMTLHDLLSAAPAGRA